MKAFLFKMHNNILGLNNRVAHFADVPPTCTFCTLARRNDAENEDTLHLFYACPYTERILVEFFSWAFHTEHRYTITRSNLFTIYEDLNGRQSMAKTLIAKTFLRYIWDCKLRHTLPAIEDAKELTKSIIMCMYDASSVFRAELDGSGLANIFLQG
jgi:hypothetical protein